MNIGGCFGPLVAAQLRQLAWDYVFYACAAIICLNFLLLLVNYREGRRRTERRERAGEASQEP